MKKVVTGTTFSKINLIKKSCLSLLFLAGCTIGPDYRRPAIEIPDTFRGATLNALGPGESASLGDEQWWDVFQDKTLQGLITTALQQNYDVRIAADEILEARQQLNISNSYELPTITAGGGPQSERVEKIRTSKEFQWNSFAVTGSLSWDIDFWGEYRRLIEASRADLLAAQWARREVITTLIADLAGAYFQLRELDLELEISRDTLASRQGSLKLTQQLADHGSASMLDVRQAEQLVYTAAENIPDLERRIAQQENYISVLLGQNPGDVSRGLSLTQEPHAPQVPAGLPSSLIERRPDIKQAEEMLVAANAQIGAAEGAYFPNISLTGTGGYQSAALSQLFTGPSGMWTFAADLTQPVFNGGRLGAQLKLAKAQYAQALHNYQKTIQEAFREVSDALIAYRKTQEFTVQQDLLTQAAKDAVRLSDLRYKGGSSSYLDVLESETSYYSARLALAQSRLSELQAVVTLYQALGGGWQN